MNEAKIFTEKLNKVRLPKTDMLFILNQCWNVTECISYCDFLALLLVFPRLSDKFWCFLLCMG